MPPISKHNLVAFPPQFSVSEFKHSLFYSVKYSVRRLVSDRINAIPNSHPL